MMYLRFYDKSHNALEWALHNPDDGKWYYHYCPAQWDGDHKYFAIYSNKTQKPFLGIEFRYYDWHDFPQWEETEPGRFKVSNVIGGIVPDVFWADFNAKRPDPL
jgi:hypothetical protein